MHCCLCLAECNHGPGIDGSIAIADQQQRKLLLRKKCSRDDGMDTDGVEAGTNPIGPMMTVQLGFWKETEPDSYPNPYARNIGGMLIGTDADPL